MATQKLVQPVLTDVFGCVDPNPQIAFVQKWLSKFGYLKSPLGLKEGILDHHTQKALLKYQKFYRLHTSGIIDNETAAMMNKARCGNDDSASIVDSISSNYVTSPCKHQSLNLSAQFLNTSIRPTPSVLEQRKACYAAVNEWTQYIPNTILFQTPRDNSFGWYTGEHGDGAPFDGPGKVLAHAFFPCGGSFSGQVHFDDSENWSVNGSGIDLQTVALHELGHGLGLNHSGVREAIMYATYSGIRRSLHPDDIAGIQAMYGALTTTFNVTVHIEGIGDMLFKQNQFAGTRGESKRCEGFQIDFAPPIPGLGLEYMAHIEGIGDTNWVPDGTFIGTRGQSKRLEGFAIRTTGSAASQYNVFYMAHLEGVGDTDLFSNGQFCGTRGQSRRMEGLLVKILPK